MTAALQPNVREANTTAFSLGPIFAIIQTHIYHSTISLTFLDVHFYKFMKEARKTSVCRFDSKVSSGGSFLGYRDLKLTCLAQAL